jgi:hypothetical protein
MTQSSKAQDFVQGEGSWWPWGKVLTEEELEDLIADK